MMSKIPIILMFALVCFAGANAVPTLMEEDAERSGRFPCMGTARYRVEVSFAWSGATHGASYPANGSLSPHVVASHGRYYTMWSPLGFSSEGVQDVAETGNLRKLVEELQAQVNRNVLTYRAEDGPSSGTATVTARVRVNGGRSYITSISMLFPSPDWFTGIQAVNTCNEETGEFVDELTGNLSAWDAVTDVGTEFTSQDAPLRPAARTAIVSILAREFMSIPIGTYRITKL